MLAQEANAYRELGEDDQEEESLRRALELEKRSAPQYVPSTLHQLGLCLKKRGKVDQARQIFERFLTQIESQRAGLASDEAKVGFLGLHVYGSLDYLDFLFETDRNLSNCLRGLEVSEKVRARGLLDLMARDPSIPRIPLKGDFAEVGLAVDEIGTPSLATPSVERLLSDLADRSDTALVSYCSTRSRVIVWVVRPGLPPQCRELPVSPSQLRTQALDFIYALPFLDDDMLERELFDDLVRPIEDLLPVENPSRVTIIPHGHLHSVPFAALSDAGVRWIEKAQICVAPSLTIAAEQKTAVWSSSDRILLVGRPAGAEELANAESEIRGVAELFGDAATVLLGKSAAKQAVLDEMRRADGLLFSTHGDADEHRPKQSYLFLAGGQRLTLGELTRMHLKAKIAVLSACQTHSGRIDASNELMALSRGFLAAGVRCVLATLWSVNDRAASEMMLLFFRFYRDGMPPPAALRAAQLRYLEEQPPERRGVRRWAPWVVLGRSG